MLTRDCLSKKKVLVTGGGTGIGKTIGRKVIELGGELVICGRRTEILQATAAEFDALGKSKTRVLTCDLRVADEVHRMMDALWEDGPPDVVVSNAAGTIMARSETLSARAADAVLQVSLHGAMYLSLEAGRRWIDKGHPGLLMYTLAAGYERGRPFMVPLTVAKGGLQTLIQSLAVEWGRHGIRTIGVSPGYFPTPGADARLQAGRSSDPAASIPLGRVGSHAELGEFYAFFMSDAANYVTGQVVTIDGGRSLRTSGIEDLFDWSEDQWNALRPRK